VAEKDDYLADVLVDLGLLQADRLAKARDEAVASGVGVIDLLLANKVIRSADVTQAKAAQFGAEVVQLGTMPISDEAISIIPRHVAKKYRVIPILKSENKVAVAIADPSDLNTIDSLTHLLNAEIELRVASEADIEAALNKYYGGTEKKKGMEDSRFKDVIEELTQSEVGIIRVDDEGTVEVPCDALLIGYSDGLIEPENVYGEEFGIPRLEQAAVRVQNREPREVCESLMASVEEWAGTPEQADDMTVIVARLR